MNVRTANYFSNKDKSIDSVANYISNNYWPCENTKVCFQAVANHKLERLCLSFKKKINRHFVLIPEISQWLLVETTLTMC